MATFKRFLFIVFFLGLIPTSCWKKENRRHFRLGDFAINVYDNHSSLNKIDSTTSVSDSTILFRLYSTISYLANQTRFSLINKSYATSKPRPGKDGLDIKLSDIKITSDKLFNGITSGTKLNSLFKWQKTYRDASLAEINELINELNAEDINQCCDENYEFDFVLQSKPTDSLTHRFTFDFIYVDGTVQSATSEKLTWE